MLALFARAQVVAARWSGVSKTLDGPLGGLPQDLRGRVAEVNNQTQQQKTKKDLGTRWIERALLGHSALTLSQRPLFLVPCTYMQ